MKQELTQDFPFTAHIASAIQPCNRMQSLKTLTLIQAQSDAT